MNVLKILIAFLFLSIPLIRLQAGNDSTATQKPKGPIAEFRLDGNGMDAISGHKAVVQKGKAVESHDGKPKGAFAFSFDNKTYSKYTRNITFPVDINPSKCPELTITAWVRASNTFQTMYVLGNETDDNCRGIIIKLEDGIYRWGANCGKDGMLWGPPLVEGWTFVAVIYDSKNQEVRLVVNDQAFASRGTARSGEEKAFVGALDGAIDEIRFYDRILSQSEIEAVSGKPITKDADVLTIKDKYSYRERMKQEKENKLKINGIYILDKEEFTVNDTTINPNTKAVLHSGDSLVILEKLADGWYKIGYQNGKTGFARRSAIVNGAYPAGGSALMFRFSNWFSRIFDFSRMSSWIVVVICAIILFLVKRYFVRLDYYLLRLRRNRDEFEDGGSKSGASVPRRTNFLHKIYPVQSFQWYPLLGGILLGATIFIGSFWDTYEMEWFFNEGINLLPIGYDRPIHWFLYSMTVVIFLITLSWIIESFVVGGPFVGLLRIFILLILNFMSLLVSFFLLILIAIIVLIVVGLWIFGSAVRSGSYKCPSCGRKFSAGAGSSVSCPGCGASLST